MSPEIVQILSHFPIGKIVSMESLAGGILHATYHVQTENDAFILQKMNPVIAAHVMEDIENVTTYLSAHDIRTYKIIRTTEEKLTYDAGDFCWRLMTYIAGTSIAKGPSLDQAHSAGVCVAHFHDALSEYARPFAHRLVTIHDPAYAFKELRRVYAEHQGSEKEETYAPIVHDILSRCERQVRGFESLPLRVLHGDPKLSNVRFDESEKEAIAMIDLDTIGRYPLPLEIGDMLRSWCKDDSDSFKSNIWQSALNGYRPNAPFVTQAEWTAIPDGFIAVTLSLAARYMTDAFEERYFAFDADLFASLSEQNIYRSSKCIALLDDFAISEKEIREFHK